MEAPIPQAAALPRALDVQRFAGAREQEIRSLVSALQAGPLGSKFGVAALPRHMRRRAGSHKPFHAHRLRPNAKLQGKRRKVQEGEQEAAGGGGDTATKAQQEGGAAAAQSAAAHAARPFTNRRMRRAPALLAEQHRQAATWNEASVVACAAAMADAEGSGGSTASLRRLETHVWHAKRLAMEERYGWLLPAGAAGQGRGSRSFAHVAKTSSLMHDASYLCPLLLHGSWPGVHAALAPLLPPGEAAALAKAWAEAASSGVTSNSSSGSGWEQEVWLHHPGRYPRGAICPAQLLLCPGSGGGSAEQMDVDGAAAAAAAAHVQACLWVHPAAAAEVHGVLRQAMQQQQQPGGQPGVCLQLLDLRRLEIRGGSADVALGTALAGATAGGDKRQAEGEALAGGQQKQGQQQRQGQAQLPPAVAGLEHGDAVQLLLPDPRLCKPVTLGSAAASLLPPEEHAGAAGQPRQQVWDLTRLLGVSLPLSEAEVSSRRQQVRRGMLQLEAAGGGGSEEAQQELRRRCHCPAVLVRHDPPGQGGMPGWSLILPSGWAQPFWLAAAFAACKPAGQREWRWLHALQQRPCFPWDCPDTAAYAALMQQQAQARRAAAARRPTGKQMLGAPAPPPPWQHLLPAAQAQQRLQAAAPLTDEGATGAVAAAEQQQAPMEVDSAPQQTVAAPPAAPPLAERAAVTQLCVARTYAAMAAALQGSAGGGTSSGAHAGSVAPPSGSRPVARALRQGLLQWRPKQQQQQSAGAADPAGTAAGARSSGATSASQATMCLVEAAVFPLKTGTPAEGAAICVVAGWEAEHCCQPLQVLTARQQRRRQRQLEEQRAALAEAGGNPAAALGAAAPSGVALNPAAAAEVGEQDVQPIGFVLSEAPRGAPRRCGALAAVGAAAAWRLRSLQHWEPAADGGGIRAYLRNPGSAALFPVRLQLAVESAGLPL